MTQIPKTMHAVLLTGHGGFDQLEYRTDVATPEPALGEVLIRVRGAGVNNTDINTRTAWYSKNVTEATSGGGADGFESLKDDSSSWAGTAFNFPRIQGADCCGHIVAVGEGVASERIGERVLVRTMIPIGDPEACQSICTGSERDGAFAQYMRVESEHALTIDSDWTDVQR